MNIYNFLPTNIFTLKTLGLKEEITAFFGSSLSGYFEALASV